ncbi:small integral membrane protein 1 [Misgurnus anguillicaudatus]|uniref:small integral membrane protein 1 n=1 Tax=Misgurnus anguillicaudatus TaxID=75329 RepID=UPI003CCF3C0D
MESNEASVEYNRWSEENINMKVPNSQSRLMGVCNRLCTGQLGIAMKLAALVVVIVVIFLLGYVTGYYVHRC